MNKKNLNVLKLAITCGLFNSYTEHYDCFSLTYVGMYVNEVSIHPSIPLHPSIWQVNYLLINPLVIHL